MLQLLGLILTKMDDQFFADDSESFDGIHARFKRSADPTTIMIPFVLCVFGVIILAAVCQFCRKSNGSGGGRNANKSRIGKVYYTPRPNMHKNKHGDYYDDTCYVHNATALGMADADIVERGAYRDDDDDRKDNDTDRDNDHHHHHHHHHHNEDNSENHHSSNHNDSSHHGNHHSSSHHDNSHHYSSHHDSSNHYSSHHDSSNDYGGGGGHDSGGGGGYDGGGGGGGDSGGGGGGDSGGGGCD